MKFKFFLFILLFIISIKSNHSVYQCTLKGMHGNQPYDSNHLVGVTCSCEFLKCDENQDDLKNKKDYCEKKGGRFTRKCECSGNPFTSSCQSNVRFDNYYGKNE